MPRPFLVEVFMLQSVAAIAAAVAVAWSHGYYTAYTKAEAAAARAEAAAAAEYAALLQKKITAEKAARAEADAAAADYLATSERMKNENEKTRRALASARAQLNGVRPCPAAGSGSVPGAGADSAGLICFDAAEFRAKLQGALADAERADALAERHAALVRACGAGR